MNSNAVPVALFAALLSACSLHGQGADDPIWLSLESGQTLEVKGDLTTGRAIQDLSWAWNSAVACFPETQAAKFTGHHVLYAVRLPARSEMEVTVVPTDKSANFSLYAYEVGQVSDDNLVPNLVSAIRCEADHKWDGTYRGVTQDHTRRVSDLVAINNPYQVVIGVTGADRLLEGGYTLRVALSGR